MAEQPETNVARMDEEALLGLASSRAESVAMRGAAARELTRRDPEKAEPLLARLTRDPEAPAESRSAAASALGRHKSAVAEAALTAALVAQEPLVVRRVAEALGRIGGPDALDALRRVAVPRDPAASRALGFAKSLIAYRLGLTEELLSAPSPAPLRGEGVPLDVAPASAALKAKVAERLPRELPALDVRIAAAVRVACERQEAVVLPASTPAALLRSSGVAAVVMKRAYSLGHFATHLYLLTHPGDDGRLALFGVRPDGTITHRGEARPRDQGLDFRLEALAMPYADPMRIAGRVDAEGLVSIAEARAATAPRAPLPVPRKNEGPAISHPVLGKAPPFQPRAR